MVGSTVAIEEACRFVAPEDVGFVVLLSLSSFVPTKGFINEFSVTGESIAVASTAVTSAMVGSTAVVEGACKFVALEGGGFVVLLLVLP